MRKLMLFAIGFALACVVGVYFISGYWLLILAAVCLAAMIPLFCVRLRSTKIIAMILAGCMTGLVWNWGFDSLYLSDARNYDGKTVQTQIEITEYCYDTDYGVASDGKITLAGHTYRVKVYLPEYASIKPGDRVTGSFRLRYTADGGEKAPTYHQGKGIFLLAYAKDRTQITYARQVPAKYFIATVRNMILNQIDAFFPEDTLGFARALLLGDSSKLSYEIDSDFQVSGIRHMIAVSGMHVSILFSLVYLFGGRHKVVGFALGVPLLLAFAALAGFTPSVVRACIMQGLMLLALLVNKEYDPPTALAFAGLTILAVNPLSITSVGFQLSVACMIGIFLFSQPIYEYLTKKKLFSVIKGKTLRPRLTRWFVHSVSITVSVLITTAPLCAYYFDMVSLVSIITNLLTMWVISFIFYGIILACVAGVIWLPLGKILAWLVSWLMRYVMGIAHLLAKIPLATVYTNSIYIVAWLFLCYILLTIYFIAKKKCPGILLACVCAALSVAVAASWIEPRTDDFRFTVLDVGQGQCLILQSGSETYMIDCGSDRPKAAADRAAAMLASQGIRKLDGLILTHYDDDHANAAEYLLYRVPADTLYLPVTGDEEGMARFAERYSAQIQWVTHDRLITSEDLEISLYPATDYTSNNESSMCVLCRVDNCDILITGDRLQSGEKALLDAQELPDLEILVAGHHGSKNGTGLELLKETKPDAVVISASEDNRYGHPSQETLDRILLFGCYIYRTDQMGTIIFKG